MCLFGRENQEIRKKKQKKFFPAVPGCYTFILFMYLRQWIQVFFFFFFGSDPGNCHCCGHAPIIGKQLNRSSNVAAVLSHSCSICDKKRNDLVHKGRGGGAKCKHLLFKLYIVRWTASTHLKPIDKSDYLVIPVWLSPGSSWPGIWTKTSTVDYICPQLFCSTWWFHLMCTLTVCLQISRKFPSTLTLTRV